MSDASIHVVDLRLYPKQWEFVQCPNRLTLFIGGVGSGKTVSGLARALVEMGRHPRTLGLVVAPTYPMLRDVIVRVFERWLGPACVLLRGEMRLLVSGAHEVLLRSADRPDRLRGTSVDWAWIDEAALCPRGTFSVVLARLRSSTGRRAAPCWLTTTPKGRNNWVYENRELFTVFRASTADNPFLDPQYLEDLRRAYSGRFAEQELEGRFVGFDNLVFDRFDPERHVVRRRKADMVRVVAGVDEGYTNPAAVVIVGFDNDDRVHVLDELYQRRLLRPELVNRIRELCVRHGVEVVYVDPSSASLIAELRAVGVGARAAPRVPVIDGLRLLMSLLEDPGDGLPRLTISPSCPNLLSEMTTYTWDERRGEAPVKGGDHAIDAMRYAVVGALRGARVGVRWL